MNNEDRPTERPTTFLDVSDHNVGCIQDRFVIFGSKVWFSGRPIQRGHLNLPPTDPVCHDNEIWVKIGYNSACLFSNQAHVREEQTDGRARPVIRPVTTESMNQLMDGVCCVVVPVQLVDMCQLDLASNWTASDPEHSSNILSKEAKVLGKQTLTSLKSKPHLFRFVVDLFYNKLCNKSTASCTVPLIIVCLQYNILLLQSQTDRCETDIHNDM